MAKRSRQRYRKARHPEVLESLQTGDFGKDFPGSESLQFYAHIATNLKNPSHTGGEKIQINYGYPRIKKTLHVDGFYTRIYHIPKELLDNFNITFQDHLQDISSDIHLLKNKYSNKDWYNFLSVVEEIHKKYYGYDALAKKDHKDIFSDYVQDRIYHTLNPEVYRYFVKDKKRLVTISETLTRSIKTKVGGKEIPLLKIITDEIVRDIGRDFELQLTEKYQNYSERNIHKLLRAFGWDHKENNDSMPVEEFGRRQALKKKTNDIITRERIAQDTRDTANYIVTPKS